MFCAHEANLPSSWSCSLPDEATTCRLGEALAKAISTGLIIYLEGDLGAGKTTLVRALLRALGHQGAVKSPTYSLVEVYNISSLYFFHFDFYRFQSPEEFIDAGLDEYFRSDAVCLVEWPDKAIGFMPSADLRLAITHVGEARHVSLQSLSEHGATCLQKLMPCWTNVEN